MNAMTACADAAVPWIAYCAEHTVWNVKKSNIPDAEVINRNRRPRRSHKNDASTAQKKFQMASMLKDVG